MDRTASHKDPFQNMCLFVCSCCRKKKKKAGLFCDELGSYVTLCFYVTSLVSTWSQLLIRSTGFFSFLRRMPLIWILKWLQGELLSWILDCDLKWLLLYSDYTSLCAAHNVKALTFQKGAIKNNDSIHLRRRSNGYFALFLTEVYNGACCNEESSNLFS